MMKLKFGFVKLRDRGLRKNANQLFAILRAGELVPVAEKNCFTGHRLSSARRLRIGPIDEVDGRPGKTKSDACIAEHLTAYERGLFRVSLSKNDRQRLENSGDSPVRRRARQNQHQSW